MCRADMWMLVRAYTRYCLSSKNECITFLPPVESNMGTPGRRSLRSTERGFGVVHKVRHAIFDQFLPLPLSHFVTHL